MFSRSLNRSLRALARKTPQPLPKTSLPPPRPQSLPSTQRFRSGWNNPSPRRPQPYPRAPTTVYGRFDPEQARNAKPLITVEHIGRAIRSSQTNWLLIIGTGSATIFYLSNLEIVPLSGRTRFNCYSAASVEAEGEIMYQKVMEDAKGAILPSWDPRTKMVERVMQRLVPASGLEHVNWEVHLIQSDVQNAFVIPGGKVFVFSGILPIAKTEDGLAAILGHEIAHLLANHAGESMSKLILLAPIRWMFIALDTSGYTMGLGRVLGDIALDLGLARPGSRKQESEADYIGLMIMAKSCYDPREAVGVWKRWEEVEKAETPEWLSTHPSHLNRVEKMLKWLPKAQQAQNESDCASLIEFSKAFKGLKGAWGGLGIVR